MPRVTRKKIADVYVTKEEMTLWEKIDAFLGCLLAAGVVGGIIYALFG